MLYQGYARAAERRTLALVQSAGKTRIEATRHNAATMPFGNAFDPATSLPSLLLIRFATIAAADSIGLAISNCITCARWRSFRNCGSTQRTSESFAVRAMHGAQSAASKSLVCKGIGRAVLILKAVSFATLLGLALYADKFSKLGGEA
jgi:hypothetical protein